MNVPNHERKAFCAMTPEERAAIVEAMFGRGHGCVVEARVVGGFWAAQPSICINGNYVYRIRPSKPNVPWEHLRREVKFVFMSADGAWLASDVEPVMSDRHPCGWHSNGKLYGISAVNISTTGIDWRESLVARPE